MTTITEITDRCGQQIWLDNLSRSLIESGDLQRRIDEGVTGLTSNPSIFYQAISKDPAYQARLANIKKEVDDLEVRFETLVLKDIQDACDLFKVIYDTQDESAGFVSFEVSPKHAHDAEQTFEAAKRLWKAIDRPNAMIKIPATHAGLEAIENAIYEGINVNVTLIFSPKQLKDVQNAYLAGIRRRIASGLPVEQIASVASVFISRLDTLADKLISDPKSALNGRVAISAAKIAYQLWQTEFMISMADLPAARPQKLLWASTGTKNPAYPDLHYVENLIGPETINTVPEATLDALLDHGEAVGRLTDKLMEANSVVRVFQEAGHDLDALGDTLQKDGLALFDQAYDDLLALMKD